MTLEERFRAFVNLVPTERGCILWTGHTNRHGYGRISAGSVTDGSKRMILVHRLVLEWKLGRPIREDAMHSCGVHACVNPDHLREATRSENMATYPERGGNPRGSPCKGNRGEKHGMARLIAENILEIRALYADGKTQRQIAGMFGVSRSHIGKIITRKVWAHLDGGDAE
jgi:hypothetical protein